MEQGDNSSVGVHSLPTELLIHIFIFLSCEEKAVVARVCPAWRDAAYSPPLWQNQLVRINLDAMCSFRYSDLAERGVQRVVVLSCQRPQAISDLSARLKFLVYLDLRPCRSLSEACLRTAFSSGMPKLRVLKMGVVVQKCSFVMGWLLDKLPSVENLTLEGDVMMTTLKSHSPRLRRLRQLKMVSKTLTDHGVSYLCATQQDNGPSPMEEGKIQHLALGGSTLLTDEALKDISQGFPNLVTLQLTDCTLITQVGLSWLSGLSKLRNFTLARGNLKREDLVQLRELCRGLVSLNLDLHPNLGDDLVRTLASAHSLCYLSLRGIIFSEEAILRLIDSLPRLRKLALCPISPDFRDKVKASRPSCCIVPKLTSN